MGRNCSADITTANHSSTTEVSPSEVTAIPNGNRFHGTDEGNEPEVNKNHVMVSKDALNESAVTVDPKLTIFASNGRLYHYLLPSFVKMIYDLHAEGRRFSIILRTYGIDGDNVLSSIDHIVRGNHPQFPGSLPLRIQRNPGYIRRYSDGRICCELPRASEPLSSTDTPASAAALDTDGDIYRIMSDSEGVSGFVDDFGHWQDNGYCHLSGKPLWVDPSDDDVHHIFFDDNIRVTDQDSIVDVRLFETDDDVISDAVNRKRKCRSLALDEVCSLENACLVQADLLECTSELDYFKRKIDECEVKYSTWLTAKRLQRSQTSLCND